MRNNQDEYYGNSVLESDQASNRNMRRHGCKSQEPRGPNQVDDNLGNIKVQIPSFQGRINLEAYLEWEKKIELVKIAIIEFSNYAIIRWDQLTLNRKHNEERPKLQNLTQGNQSVDDYFKEMEISMIRANVDED
ncbi:mutant gag-pol polyprotein [Gossypium australe]|uniref:Mutant gag-pol polyprotein n=1 Tax=Gossypium australe TaxID=47621 RepID=A0A5B6W996_9ROSI|nr:mutant gag-pol polyprotein [Gossypium australe]